MLAQSGQQAAPLASQQLPQILLSSLLLIATQLQMALPAQAEIRVVTAQGEYRMGDRDTREDAIRMATESAKRNCARTGGDLSRKYHGRGWHGCHQG